MKILEMDPSSQRRQMDHPRWTAIVGWALIVAGLLSMIVSAISSSSIDPDAFQETQGVRAGAPQMSLSVASPFIAGMDVLIVAINKRLRLERVLLSPSVGIVGWLLVAPAGAAFTCSFTAQLVLRSSVQPTTARRKG
jgi:hypothetical protein